MPGAKASRRTTCKLICGFSLSAAQGYQDAIKNRDVIAAQMTPEQIAEAQKLARDWKPTTQPPQ